MEDRLSNMRKKAQTGENDDKLADMLNEYGELVKRVDEDLKSQRDEELNSLEARLLQRRRDKRQAIADKAKQIEEGLNKEGVEDRSDLQERL
jgi:flagellar biosynthesis/type III secretory pathway protein FliH